MNDHNFEFYLPEGAQIDQSMAKTANGQPINSAAVPQSDKNRYAFLFPLRPGETQFQVAYHVPYSGQASLDPRLLYPAEHFVVMLPRSMQFTAAPGTAFQSMQDPQQSDSTVEVATRTEVGQPLAFKVSGTGVLQSEQEGSAQASAGGGGGMVQGRDSRPGGGLGPPIDAPDPLEKFKWYILAGFALILAGGAYYVIKRQPVAVTAGDASPLEIPVSDKPRRARAAAADHPSAPPSLSAAPTTGPRSSMLLEALKEELFQLEIEHKQGSITQQEYEKAKAALDQTLQRALKRETQKTT
jgi:hypothetical protein